MSVWIEFQHKRRKYEYHTEEDHDHGPPWEEECGHGPVTEWRRGRDKRPGERVLNEDGRSYRFYDFQEAVRLARKDGWGAPDNYLRIVFGQQQLKLGRRYDREKHRFMFETWKAGLTAKQRASYAAEADFERLQGWCNDHWRYIGVVVRDARGEEASLWGIENDADDAYLDEIKGELADELYSRRVDARRRENLTTSDKRVA